MKKMENGSMKGYAGRALRTLLAVPVLALGLSIIAPDASAQQRLDRHVRGPTRSLQTVIDVRAGAFANNNFRNFGFGFGGFGQSALFVGGRRSVFFSFVRFAPYYPAHSSYRADFIAAENQRLREELAYMRGREGRPYQEPEAGAGIYPLSVGKLMEEGEMEKLGKRILKRAGIKVKRPKGGIVKIGDAILFPIDYSAEIDGKYALFDFDNEERIDGKKEIYEDALKKYPDLSKRVDIHTFSWETYRNDQAGFEADVADVAALYARPGLVIPIK